MGEGRLPGWRSLIMPFKDRPDIEVPIIWYSVPHTIGDGPISFVSDNWWDDRERYVPFGVGNVPHSMVPYFGPTPIPALGPLVGSADQWANGVSYADWVAAGSPQNPSCVQQLPGAPKVKSQERTAVSLDTFGGCRQQGSACPGLLIPCVINCKFSRTVTTYYNGPATWSAAVGGWITPSFTTPMFGTRSCTLKDDGSGGWNVFIGTFLMVPFGASCTPFDVLARLGLFPGYNAEFTF